MRPAHWRVLPLPHRLHPLAAVTAPAGVRSALSSPRCSRRWPSYCSPPRRRAQSGVPGAPTGLTVTDGHRAVELHWTAPADDGGSPITGYEIAGSGLYATGITSTSYIVDTGEFDGISFLRVRAVNANGNGAWSDNWLGEVRSATLLTSGGNRYLR